MLKVYVWNISDELIKGNDNEYFANLLSQVSNERKEKVLSLKNRTDQIRSICAYLLALTAVNDMLTIRGQDALAELVFRYAENGKPILVSKYNMHVNISHSGDYVACVSGEENAGIDIQMFRGYKESVVKRFFSVDEQEHIECVAGQDKARGVSMRSQSLIEKTFYNIWVQKEAYIKYTGLGMKQSLRDFSMLRLKNEKTVCFDAFEYYSLAVCCEKSVEISEDIVIINKNPLVN